MELAQIGGMAANTMTILNPYLVTLATAAAPELGKAVPAAIGKLWAAVTGRVAAKATAKEAVDDLKAEPQNEKCVQAFEWQLEKILKEDHNFATELAGLLKETGHEIKASGNATVVVGHNNKVVGAGGIMVGDHSDGNVINTGKIDNSFINTGKILKKSK